MNNKLDPETLKIPAYMRKKMIVSQSRQKLILTALDRKQAHLPPGSTVATAPFRRQALSKTAPVKPAISKTPRTVGGFSPSSFARVPAPALTFASSSAIGGYARPSVFQSGKSFPQTGNITHYLDKIGVAIIMLNAPLKNGDHIIVEGVDELFIQKVEEMQIDRQPVNKAKKGAHIGLKVCNGAKVNGSVYKLS